MWITLTYQKQIQTNTKQEIKTVNNKNNVKQKRNPI